MTQQHPAPRPRGLSAPPSSRPASRPARGAGGPPPSGLSLHRAARSWWATAALVALLSASAVGHGARAADVSPMPTADAVGLVKRVAGTVQLQRKDGPQPLKEGQSLVATDRLITGPDGVAAVVFRDGTQLTVGASTDLHLRRYAFEPKADDYAFDVYLAKGRAIYASGKIGKLAPQTVRLDTPTATVGVRGTRLILEAE